MLEHFLLGMTLGLPAALQPGPLQAYLLSQTLKNGALRTLPAALAPLLSDGPIVLLVLLILSQTPPWFLRFLRMAGGLFLLFLAWQALSSASSAIETTPDGRTQSIRDAALTNLLNPNPYIFWTTVAGPIVVDAWRMAPSLVVSFGVGFYGVLVGGSAALILFFGSVGRLNARLHRGLSGVSAVALLGFGLLLLWQAVQGV